jgi:prepilin-type N-terminal cleavage/methylation domain-containing protein
MKTIKSLRSKIAAFTLIELLVVISIIAVLASLALPAVTGALVKGQITQTTSNYRQLYILTQSASLDQTSSGTTNPVWPGDVGGSVALWQAALTNGSNYCAPGTLSNLLSVKGTTNNSSVQLVSGSMNPANIFICTANLTNTGVQNSAPYNLKGAALVTVGGSAVTITGTNYNSNVATFGTN